VVRWVFEAAWVVVGIVVIVVEVVGVIVVIDVVGGGW
jgi:hypothetical protein